MLGKLSRFNPKMPAVPMKQNIQEHKKVYLSRNMVVSHHNLYPRHLVAKTRYISIGYECLLCPRDFIIHHCTVFSMPRSLLKSSRLIDSYTVNSYSHYTRHKREKERRTVSYFINGFDFAYKKFRNM